ncbi:MAG: amino acid permease, partial [Actinobacteria bacterium]|nr:amino acid permease [Actinomycetota bacterium]
FLGFGAAGPAYVWVYVAVGIVQLLTALCLAEMAGHVPVAGSMYMWSKYVTKSRFVPWMAGWILVAAMIVTVTVAGPTIQATLTTVSHSFEFVGGPSDYGTSLTHDGAINAIILGAAATLLTTILNIVSVRWTGRITTVAVGLELLAVAVIFVGFLFHIERGPGVLFETHGTGAAHSWGWFGAFLVAVIAGAYVFFGFESAATLAEETKNPRKTSPRAILRALLVSVIIGVALAFLAMMAVPDINSEELATVGFPFVITSTLGSTLGDVLLVIISIAAVTASLAIQATGVRIIFAMARDGRLPFSREFGHVSGRWHTPVFSTVFVGVAAVALLFLNYGNARIFSTISAVAILLFYICYLMVIGPMLLARMRGEWPRGTGEAGFSLGRWGTLVNFLALIGSLAVAIDVAWPRAEIYGEDHWYLQYGAFTFTGVVVITGLIYWFAVQRHRGDEVLDEHAATQGHKPLLGEVGPASGATATAEDPIA